MLQDFKSEIKVFFIVAAVAIIVAVTGIFLLKGAGLGPSSPTPSLVPSPQAQGIEGWQTYRNDEFGFEVKYPEGWIAQGRNIINPISGSSFGVTKNENSASLSLDEWFQQGTLVEGRPTVKAAAERILINGVPAYKFETDLPPPNPLFEAVAIADNRGDIFSIYAYYGIQEDAKILRQILSTFRFTGNSKIGSKLEKVIALFVEENARELEALGEARRGNLVRMRADFNGDGLQDIGLSLSAHWGNAGGSWKIYLADKNDQSMYTSIVSS